MFVCVTTLANGSVQIESHFIDSLGCIDSYQSYVSLALWWSFCKSRQQASTCQLPCLETSSTSE